ncbi:MAG: ABC transporter ATP-binding protein [Duncaniella sp.]|nr:ABC transporter ATP-binding protein [Duncaniella sp.]MDE6178000.1 ABC transporter ATP-binding protein [Duncaniella sp.]
MLSVNNLTFSYSRGAVPVINDVSFSIEPGRVCGLLGRNGVGKTTLLQLIAGALTPAAGWAALSGVDTRRRLPSVMSELFVVPDRLELPALSISRFAAVNGGFYPRFSEEAMARCLDMFKLDASLRLDRLSLGQQKKAFISFAVACNTSLLLMDEPTDGLDIPSKEAFRRIIAENMTDERSIVISTHQVRDLGQLLDHVLILEGNGIVLDASLSHVAERLKFIVSDSRELLGRALYARPSFGGVEMVLPNTDGSETEVELEMLFSLAVERPDVIRAQFYTPNMQNDGEK